MMVMDLREEKMVFPEAGLEVDQGHQDQVEVTAQHKRNESEGVSHQENLKKRSTRQIEGAARIFTSLASENIDLVAGVIHTVRPLIINLVTRKDRKIKIAIIKTTEIIKKIKTDIILQIDILGNIGTVTTRVRLETAVISMINMTSTIRSCTEDDVSYILVS